MEELRKSQQEMDTKFKETDKRIKEGFELFEGQWGKLIESLVEGDLIRATGKSAHIINPIDFVPKAF